MRMCLLIAAMLVGGPGGRRSLQTCEVRVDEEMYELCKADRGRPAEARTCFRRIAHEVVELCAPTLERSVEPHVVLPVEMEVLERNLDEIPYRVALARRDDVVV